MSAPTLSKLAGLRGMSTDLLSWPARGAGSPKLVLLFIVGNPGLPAYYTRLLSLIASSLPGIDVYAVGQMGHSPSSLPLRTGAIATLREQVEAKTLLLDALDKRYNFGSGPGQTPLILCAHSIGCWLSCEVLKLRPSKIASLQLLFPTISSMALSPNGINLLRFYTRSTFPLLSAFSSTLSYLPTAFTTKLVGLVCWQEQAGAIVTTSLVVTPGVVMNALSMAREEMDQVVELDIAVLKEHGGKMRFYHAEDGKDGWVPESAVVEIYAALDAGSHDPSLRVRCPEGMVHAFVLDPVKTDLLALRCIDWIRLDFPTQTTEG